MGQNVIVTGRKSAGGNMETEWYMTEQEKAKAFPFSTGAPQHGHSDP